MIATLESTWLHAAFSAARSELRDHITVTVEWHMECFMCNKIACSVIQLSLKSHHQSNSGDTAACKKASILDLPTVLAIMLNRIRWTCHRLASCYTFMHALRWCTVIQHLISQSCLLVQDCSCEAVHVDNWQAEWCCRCDFFCRFWAMFNPSVDDSDDGSSWHMIHAHDVSTIILRKRMIWMSWSLRLLILPQDHIERESWHAHITYIVWCGGCCTNRLFTMRNVYPCIQTFGLWLWGPSICKYADILQRT